MVDALEVSDDDVNEQVDTLRKQFGSYNEVDRAVAQGDVILLDMSAQTAEGDPIEELAQTAFSYEVGEDGVVPGLDEAVIGAQADEERTFTFTPEFGEYEGQDISVTVKVTAVRERELPELNDDFALMASEFDSVAELIEDVRSKLGRRRLLERGQIARNKANDYLLEAVDFPVPRASSAPRSRSTSPTTRNTVTTTTEPRWRRTPARASAHSSCSTGSQTQRSSTSRRPNSASG